MTIIILIIFLNNNSFSQDKTKIDFDNCTFKDYPLHGKIKFVDSFPDFTVQIVESFPNLKVKIVSSFPDDCGEWQIVESFPDECGKWKFVESFPDVKIQFVDSFPDIKIKFVESFPGKP
jgi:hypothetical protein